MKIYKLRRKPDGKYYCHRPGLADIHRWTERESKGKVYKRTCDLKNALNNIILYDYKNQKEFGLSLFEVVVYELKQTEVIQIKDF